MKQNLLAPDYIFETSWEVCNKVGGIYTALSTRARTLSAELKNNLIFIGPDCWEGKSNPYFTENHVLLKDWKKAVQKEEGLEIKVGRWNIPGKPLAILINYKPLFERKNEIYGEFWEHFGVDSLHAFGDYDDSCLFAYAVGMIINHYYHFHRLEGKKVVAHFNEWQTGFGELYLKRYNPAIATVFTTHATSIGRSIAEHHKPLYDYLTYFNGDQMARELNMEAKHSVEKQSAKYADCFTTVSQITAAECTQLLNRKPDVVLPNGFENDFVPKTQQYKAKRQEARVLLTRITELLTGRELGKDAIFIATSGRYEFKNKGIDIFLDALKLLNGNSSLQREIVAFIMMPAYIKSPRKELVERLQNPYSTHRIDNPPITHSLHHPNSDPVVNQLHYFENERSRVKVIFVPSYLDEKDGIFNKSYYDMLIGFDLTVFPSYYEPWGYTPLESAAFAIPTITTDLSGFGRWTQSEGEASNIDNGVAVVHRTDSNYWEAAEQIQNLLFEFSMKNENEAIRINKAAQKIAQKALWKHFITYYNEAYHFALSNKDV